MLRIVHACMIVVLFAASGAIPASAAVNVAPTIDAIEDVTVLEDSGVTTVDLAGISAGAGDEGQSLTISVISSDMDIVPIPEVFYTSPEATGSISLLPFPDKYGEADITVTVKDDGGTLDGGVDTVTRTFHVTVTPVNDPPNVGNFAKTGIRGMPLDFLPADFTAEFYDVDMDSLATVKIVTLPANGYLTLNGVPIPTDTEIPAGELGSLTFVPSIGWYGQTSFEWNGSDGSEYAVNPTFVEITYTYAQLYYFLPMIRKPFPPPAPFNKLSPLHGAKEQWIDVLLEWQDSRDATSYEYCIDSTINLICDGTWTSTGMVSQASVYGLAYGKMYEWQVRAMNQYGVTYSDGSHNSFIRFTTVAPPAPFVKISPLHGAVNQPLTVTLDWKDSAGATSYEYCYDAALNNMCDSTWYSTGMVSYAAISGLSSGTTYEWHVRANNQYGTTYSDGGPSSFIRFVTKAPNTAFGKLSPLHGAVDLPIAMTLDWQDSPGATQYQFCIDNVLNLTCDTSWISTGLASQKYIPNLGNGTTYEWNVRAISPFGTTYSDGAPTSFIKFTTVPAPPTWVNLYTENFESNFPSGWALASAWYDAGNYYDITNQLAWGKRSCRVYAGSYSGSAVGGGSIGSSTACGGYLDDYEAWMVYGPFNLSQVNDAMLSMKLWSDIEYSYDKIGFGVSLDMDYFYGRSYTGNSSGWINQSIDLKNVYGLGNITGEQQVWIGVWFTSDFMNVYAEEGAYIDNLTLSVCPVAGACGSLTSMAETLEQTEDFKAEPAMMTRKDSGLLPATRTILNKIEWK